MSEEVPARFGIVIPSLNAAATIEQAVVSVLEQAGTFSVHLHVQDGGSTDGTLAILEALCDEAKRQRDQGKARCLTFESRPDRGYGEAIDRGFEHVHADWLGYIGADDFYLPEAFAAVDALARANPAVQWMTGEHHLVDAQGNPLPGVPVDWRGMDDVYPTECVRLGLADGVHLSYLQAEGTFWTDALWTAAGGSFPREHQLAGDFALWTRFAIHAELAAVAQQLAAFRQRPGQLSADMSRYRAEVREVQAGMSLERCSYRVAGTNRLVGMRAKRGSWDPALAGWRIEEVPIRDVILNQWEQFGLDLPWEVHTSSGMPAMPFRWLTGYSSHLLVPAPNTAETMSVVIELGTLAPGQQVEIHQAEERLATFSIERCDGTPQLCRLRVDASHGLVQLEIRVSNVVIAQDETGRRELGVMVYSLAAECAA